MKKMISLLLAVLLVGVLFAGCTGPGAAPSSNGDVSDPVDLLPAEDETPDDEPADVPANDNVSSTGSPVADSYTAYLDAKNVLITRITEGLSNNPETAFSALSLLGVTMADLALMPVALFGLGQVSMEAGLAFFGATGVTYSENGHSYSVSYANSEGVKYEFAGTYDPAADALVCTAKTDGVESIYSEYRKTSFGYVGQYYFINDDGTTSLYQLAVKGEDGTLGVSTVSGQPAALTGGESVDFPKACTEWYSIEGNNITGVTSDGTQLDFEYTPSATE